MVKQLREISGAGMMECKKALAKCAGDFDKAAEELRKKGLAQAAKKATRVASEGVIAVTERGHKITMIEVNCETDFVTKNDNFISLVKQISEATTQDDCQSLDNLKQQNIAASNTSVEDALVASTANIGEKIELRRFNCLEVKNGQTAYYVHNAVPGEANIGKIGVIVALETDSKAAEVKQFGEEVAMHIADSNPQAISIADLDPAAAEKEYNFLREQVAGTKKPENVIEKMVEGRMRKFYEEIVLLEQTSIMDDKKKVKDLLSDLNKKVGEEVKIVGFTRYALGEGVEKKEENFAEEVQKMTTA